MELNQAFGGEGGHIGQLGGEILGEGLAAFGFVIGKLEAEAAHEVLDEAAAQQVVFVEQVAAEQGQPAGIEVGIVGFELALVLAVDAADFADGGEADGNQVAVGVGGIALEVALQAAFAQGNGEFVLGLGEMVHADEDVAFTAQPLHDLLEHVELGVAVGHGIGVDAALGFEDVRQVGVVVNCQPVGGEGEHFIQRLLHGGGGLVRQAVNQIDAHGLEAGFAGGIDHHTGFFFALDAVYGLLHLLVEILNAHAHAVEAERAEKQHGFAAYFARVDFDGVFALRHQGEVLADKAEYEIELGIGEEGGGAAAEVQLRQFGLALQEFGLQGEFFFQVA